MGISIPLRALQSVKPRGALQTLSRLTISAFVIAPYLGLNVSSAFAEEANAGQDSQERGAVVDSSAPTSSPHESCRWFLDPKTFHEPQPGCQPASGGKHAGGAQRTEEAARPKPALNVPANLNTISGLVSSGVLQKSLGLPADAPLQIGGIASFIGNRLTSGGLKPNTSSGERVFGFNAALDMERLFPFAPIPGGELFSSMIQYEGGKASQYAGSIQGYDSVNAWSEKYGRHRLELYEVYWRQRLLDDRLIIKVGKIMGAAEFAQPNYPPTIPQDPSRMAWTISDLFFVPVGYLPIFQGKLPTYANTAWGAIVTVQPTPAIYAKYGFFDGNGIRYETGPRIGPNLNENTFQIAEASLSWELGDERKAGRISGGVWKQSGLMATGMLDPIKGGVLLEHGARGFFAVANQRLWYLNDTDPRGLVGWANFGYSPSQTSAVQHYLGGGVTALGLVPIRPQDTISFGFAWSRLNQGAIAGTVFASPLPAPWGWPISPYASQTRLNSTERMYQITYRFVLIPGKIVFDAGYTAIPNPGYRPNIPWANAVTLRSFVVF